jgi:tRNA pseudouridine55 synthase
VSEPSGFLLINKPSGITSFDVIRQLRRILGIKKLGHSGVLDRPASGLLVVGVNKATRLFELFAGFEKEYEADFWLGLSTSTDDLTGELLAAHDPSGVTEAQFADALGRYRGTFAQLPPAFSLAKKAGKESYRYALAGEAVELETRQVTVHASRLLGFEGGVSPAAAIEEEGTCAAEGKLAAEIAKLPKLTRARVWLQCSGGLYVRSIARDVGADLKCGGAMGRLVRTRVGPFRLDEALTLEQLAVHSEAGVELTELFQPLSAVADEAAKLVLDATQTDMVRKGQVIRAARGRAPEADVVFGVTDAQELVCILERRGEDAHGFIELSPAKVFA